MIVTTMSKSSIRSVSLPAKATGQYWLYDDSEQGSERLVSIEGVNENWVIKSNRKVKVFTDQGQALKSAILSPSEIYVLIGEDTGRICVFTEPVTEDRKIFTKYMTGKMIDLTIGRDERCDILVKSKEVSSHHATLVCREGRWHIKDESSTNGTFVNERRITETDLAMGDTIFIMGLKIVIGKSFIALNNPDGKVRVTEDLQVFVNQKVQPVDEDDEYEYVSEEGFYRSPRFKRDIETAKFVIDAPPTSPIADEMPWLLVMGSSFAMGMMSMVTLSTAIINQNVASMVMGGSMLIGTLLIPTITKRYERRRRHKKEQLRQKKYREYLDNVAAKINEECQSQQEILNENIITIQECEQRIWGVQRNLWERSIGQNDFLKVRVGHGDGFLDADISYQERKFSIDDDNLQEEMYLMCEKPQTLHNIPIAYSMYDNHISGVIGQKMQINAFAKGMIIQLAALFSYDEVKFIFLYDDEDKEAFEFVKWLPHVWSDDYRFRFIATNLNELKEVSAYLEDIIAYRKQLNENEIKEEKPYFVIFSMSKTLTQHAEMIKQILAKKENIHMSLVTFYEELKNLPKECSMVVELTGSGGRLYNKADITGKSVEFNPDIYLSRYSPLELCVKLANTTLDTFATEHKLPSVVTFLEMYGVGKVEHLNALSRWKESDPTKSLEAAVGVDAMGDLFNLDLHERFHGPHGLVAGMTGSGKSEFIITYILSLAVNYHPYEVAFILIDYKGGGMAKSFERLPHTAGIITNLDGASIKRSLVAIESELMRRQEIFAQTGKKVGVSNIDIYKYQKLYREGVVTEPLQHLFIISDEFAELKTQQPEFMTQLVSAARIGRSLGVHLILATQKPSGVVDDQIWSNSKFRVCLKVQERADSMDMLKRADAAELTDTGRFYLQVGYNELFEMGQSAWAGAPYYPSDRVQKETDNSVVVIDTNGHPIKEIKIDRKRALSENAPKQLDVITDYLCDIARDEGVKIRPLWLQPIPALIILDKIKQKYYTDNVRFCLNPVIGEYDDPAHQRHCVLRLPISEGGNTIIYGAAGSGKTTFLNAMIYSLIHDHTPEELSLYILDFASETLRAFAMAPHVGDVVLSYETEKISNLFKMLQSELAKRKKLFADYGGDYVSYIKTSGSVAPSVVVVINNFVAFTELYEQEEEAISFLTREGTKYGINFVLSSPGVGGVRFRLLQNFKQLITLQLNDETDYSTVVGKTDGLFPSAFKGRGLIKRDELYEFQVASLTEEDNPYLFIQNVCSRLSAAWSGKTAKRIPILPDKVDIKFLKNYVRDSKKLSVPIGVEKNSLNIHYYPFGSRYINIVLSAESDYQRFVADLAVLIGSRYRSEGVIFDMPKLVTQDTGSLNVVSTSKDCESAIDKLFDMTLYRNNTYKDAQEQGTDCEKFESAVIIINSLTMLRSSLSDQGNEKLSLILEKGTLDYNIVILIGEQANAISSVSYDRWYKNSVSTSDGIWVGSGITEQYQLKASKTTKEMHEDITADFGFSLIRGKAVKVKLLNERTGKESDDK